MGETSMNRYVIVAKSNGASANLAPGGSKTISAGYLASAVTIAANKPTAVYAVSGAGTAGASGKPVTDTSKVYWDMGETSANRYVSIPKSTASATSLGAGGSATIPVGYVTSQITITAAAATKPTGKYTLSGTGTAGASGNAVTTNTAQVYWDMGESSANRYVIVAKSDGASASLNAGGSKTISAGYLASAVTISANKPTAVYAVSGSGTAGASGRAVTDTTKVFWDMGETSMNRYVSITKSNGASASLAPGGSKTISAGYLASAVTISANKPTAVYPVSGSGTAGASGRAVTDTTKVFWDMGETSANRYVSIPKSTASATTLSAGGSATIPVGYVTSQITITAASATKPTGKYTLTGTGKAGASGDAVTTNTAQVYWDMGETSANRYVIVAKSDGASASLNAGGSKTISAGYLASAVTVTANKRSGEQYTTAAGTVGGSGKAVTDSSKVFWDMGETSMSRYFALPNKGNLNWKPTTGTTQTVAAGYYTGGTLDSTAAYNAGYSAGLTAGGNAVTSTPKTYDKITTTAATGVVEHSVTAGYYNKVKVDQTNAYNAGVTAGKKAITDGVTTVSVNTTGGTGNETISVTAGYYNKVTVNRTAAYNAGVSSITGNPKTYSTITSTAATGVVEHTLQTAGYYNKVKVDQTNAYNAGVTAGKKSITDGVTTVKVTTTGGTGSETLNVTAGYYNKVTIDRTAAYNAGYNKGKSDATSGDISQKTATDTFYSFSGILATNICEAPLYKYSEGTITNALLNFVYQTNENNTYEDNYIKYVSEFSYSKGLELKITPKKNCKILYNKRRSKEDRVIVNKTLNANETIIITIPPIDYEHGDYCSGVVIF